MDLNIKTGKQSKELRYKLRLNQAQFWTPVGVTQSGGSRYENERDIPKPVAMLLNLVYGSKAQALKLLKELRGDKSELVLNEGEPRTILHIEAGNSDWNPSAVDMKHLVELFKEASVDQAGGVVVTREGVKATLRTVDSSDSLVVVTAHVSVMPSVVSTETYVQDLCS